MGCASSICCVTNASPSDRAGESDDMHAPPAPNDGKSFTRMHDGSCDQIDRKAEVSRAPGEGSTSGNRVRKSGAENPTNGAVASSDGKLSEAVTPRGSPSQDVENQTGNSSSGLMTSGDVRGWLDNLMANRSISGASDHSGNDPQSEARLCAPQGKNRRTGSNKSSQPTKSDVDTVQLFDTEELKVAPLDLGHRGLDESEDLDDAVRSFDADCELTSLDVAAEPEDARRPMLRSGVLSIIDSPIPLSMQLDKALNAPEEIKDIQLKGCSVDNAELQTIMKAIKKRGVRGLTLARSNITDAQAAELGRFLHECEKSSTPLEQLGLDGNPGVSDRGATALAVALRSNSSLTELSLWGTQVGDEGASALAGALKTNRALQQLWLGECEEVTDAGACALRESLTENTTLQQLGLICTGVSEDLQGEIEDLVQSQRQRAVEQRRRAAAK